MPTVLVIYHSDTGNTKKLAELIGQGASSVAGVQVQVVAAEGLDMNAAATAGAIAIGSPDYFSYVAGSVKTFFDKAYSDARFKGKPCLAFGTHGGGGKVLAVVENLSKAVGMKAVATGIQTSGAPGAADSPKAIELGKSLAKAAAAR